MNDFLKNTLETIAFSLSECLPDIDVIYQFPNVIKPLPVTKPKISLGTKSVSFGDLSLGQYAGTDENGCDVYCRKCTLTVRMRIYLPRNRENTSAEEIFERAVSALVSSPVSKDISSVSLGALSSDKSTDCYVCDSEIIIYSIINTTTKKSPEASGFLIIREEKNE